MSVIISVGDRHQASSIVLDYDNNVYHTVTIGTQEWLMENLKTTHYNNGDAIPNITSDGSPLYEWGDTASGAYCWYDNDINNKDVYGALYNWLAVNDARSIAPVGFRVATETDIDNLITLLGGLASTGGKLKETGTLHWTTPNTGASDEFGFKAVPNGFRQRYTTFHDINIYAGYWTSTSIDADYARIYELYNNTSDITQDQWVKNSGMAVRCVRDIT
jgi:uncharacterized protein (TIGR02145 family)